MAKYLLVAALCSVLALSTTGCAANGRKSMENGKKLMAQKDYPRALLEFRNAMRHFPKDADVIYHVALGYLAVGDLQNGVRHLQAATQINPNHAAAQIKLAEVMALGNNSDLVAEAEKRAKLAIDASKDNADAVAILAFAELRQGKTESAEKRLLEVIEKSPQALKASAVLANLRMSQRDYAGAGAIFRKAAETNPKSTDAWFSLARYHVVMKQFAEAEAATRKVLEIDPLNEVSLQDLAMTQLAQGKRAEAEGTMKRLTQHPSKKYLASHALYLYQQGKREEAEAELAQLHKANPKDRTLRSQLVAAHLSMQKIDAAEKTLNEALSQNPKDVDALLQRGQIFLLAGKLDELENDLNQVLKYKADSGQAHYLMARLHQARGQAKNAQRELYEALKLDPDLLAARIDTAKSLTATGGAKAALELLDAAPEDQKQTQAYLIQRNWVLMAMQETAKAQKGIEAAYAMGRVPEALFQDALMQLSQKRYAAARALMKEAIQAKPDELRIVQALAESHLMEDPKRVAAGLAEVRAYVDQYPQSAPAKLLLSNWQVAANDPAGARQTLVSLLDATPNFKGASFALAQLDLANGNLDQARKTLNGLMAADPKDAGAVMLLAMIEERAGATDQAMEAYRKVVALEPNNAAALNNLAFRLSLDAAKADEALRYAQKAKEAAPQSAAVDDTLGWVYYQKGLYSTAVKHFESATMGANATPVRLYHLAMAYQKTGQTARARSIFSKAKKDGPQLPEAAMAKRVLGIAD